jgi:hypothetical protein
MKKFGKSSSEFRERTDRKLPECERNEKAAQQATEFRQGNLKLGANPRKRREDDVGGERAERSQTGEQEQNPSSHTALGRRGHHGFCPGPGIARITPRALAGDTVIGAVPTGRRQQTPPASSWRPLAGTASTAARR